MPEGSTFTTVNISLWPFCLATFTCTGDCVQHKLRHPGWLFYAVKSVQGSMSHQRSFYLACGGSTVMLEGSAVMQLRHVLTDNACDCASTQPKQGRHLPVPALLY